jgi:hypothetical protein
MKKLMIATGFAAVFGLFTAFSASANTDRYHNGFPRERTRVVVVKKEPTVYHEEVKVVKYGDRGRFDRGPNRYRYERERYYHNHYDPRCR